MKQTISFFALATLLASFSALADCSHVAGDYLCTTQDSEDIWTERETNSVGSDATGPFIESIDETGLASRIYIDGKERTLNGEIYKAQCVGDNINLTTRSGVDAIMEKTSLGYMEVVKIDGEIIQTSNCIKQ